MQWEPIDVSNGVCTFMEPVKVPNIYWPLLTFKEYLLYL